MRYLMWFFVMVFAMATAGSMSGCQGAHKEYQDWTPNNAAAWKLNEKGDLTGPLKSETTGYLAGRNAADDATGLGIRVKFSPTNPESPFDFWLGYLDNRLSIAAKGEKIDMGKKFRSISMFGGTGDIDSAFGFNLDKDTSNTAGQIKDLPAAKTDKAADGVTTPNK